MHLWVLKRRIHGARACWNVSFHTSLAVIAPTHHNRRIHKVGLLPRCNHQQVPFAYNMYSRDDEEGWALSSKFKKAFSINVDIEFVGVWYVRDASLE